MLIACGNVIRQASTERSKLVTFNGSEFDLRFVRHRMLRAGLSIPGCLLDGSMGRWGKNHTDLRMVLSEYDKRAPGTLTRWCEVARVAEPTPHTGASIQEAADRGAWDELAAVCRQDVRALAELYGAVYGVDIPGAGGDAEANNLMEGLEDAEF